MSVKNYTMEKEGDDKIVIDFLGNTKLRDQLFKPIKQGMKMYDRFMKKGGKLK